MMKGIYRYFDMNLTESHRAKMYICTLLDPRFKSHKMWPTRKQVKIKYAGRGVALNCVVVEEEAQVYSGFLGN